MKEMENWKMMKRMEDAGTAVGRKKCLNQKRFGA